MDSKNPIIQIRALKKIFKGDVGVKDISFNVNKGEIFGFLGPNGAGKSTTIKMMLDIIRPDSGEVIIFGKSAIKDSIYIRQHTGYLPGEFKAFDRLTGQEFLDLSSRIKKEKYNIEPLLESLELSKSALKRKVNTYSQGMKQKLGIINAIATQPKLLILDEPSTGLDPIIQFRLYDLLKDLAKNGTTILFSSHNLPEVERICDSVAVIREGRLVIVSKLEELRNQYRPTIYLKLQSPLEDVVIKGAKILGFENETYHLEVEENINQVIDSINKFDIKELIIPEPSLEEIFKSYYEN